MLGHKPGASASVGAVAAIATLPARGSRRRRLWEFEGFAHCPVIGVCLPIANLRRLVTKVWGVQSVMDDYDLHCGAIAAFFPGAHIIHVFRNPADNFLSGYKARLLAAHSYFDSPERFLPYFAEYRRLMEHWYKVIPNRIHPLHYEKLVTEPRGTIAGLLSFCGLEWEEDCLYPERGEQRSATASLVQARNPINAKSVGNWKRYQSHLQVIQDRLGEGLFPAA